VEADPALEGSVSIAPERRTGFTAGLRLGVGVPLGKAGEDILTGAERDLNDLTTWRAPVWVDVGYSPSSAFTIGAYAQIGVGGNGDACTADCDWSDVRVGAEAELRFAPGAVVNPWLGVGLGYEWLSYRVLAPPAQFSTVATPGAPSTPSLQSLRQADYPPRCLRQKNSDPRRLVP
jgi:hypothetical protein